mgnify:CR=1 FL=1
MTTDLSSRRSASEKSFSGRENPTRSHGMRQDSFRVRRFLFLLFRWRGWIAFPLLVSLCFPFSLYANPSGGLVMPGGQAVISSHGSTLTVNPAARIPALARKHGAYLAILNQGETALDREADFLLHAPAGPALTYLANSILDSSNG